MEIFQSFRYACIPLFVLFKFSRLCTSDKLWATTACALHSGMCIRRLCTTTHVIILYARYLPTPPLLHFLFSIPPPPTRSICSTDVCIYIYIYTHINTHTLCDCSHRVNAGSTYYELNERVSNPRTGCPISARG